MNLDPEKNKYTKTLLILAGIYFFYRIFSFWIFPIRGFVPFNGISVYKGDPFTSEVKLIKKFENSKWQQTKIELLYIDNEFHNYSRHGYYKILVGDDYLKNVYLLEAKESHSNFAPQILLPIGTKFKLIEKLNVKTLGLNGLINDATIYDIFIDEKNQKYIIYEFDSKIFLN